MDYTTQGQKVIYDAFLSGEQQSKKASGIDEDCDEVTQLLTEYHEIVEERAICRADDQKVKIQAEKANEAGGRAIRDAAMATVERCRKEEKPSSIFTSTFLNNNDTARMNLKIKQ
ncbi:unnamed protein product, partial [Aphanomyces euteiches]